MWDYSQNSQNLLPSPPSTHGLWYWRTRCTGTAASCGHSIVKIVYRYWRHLKLRYMHRQAGQQMDWLLLPCPADKQPVWCGIINLYMQVKYPLTSLAFLLRTSVWWLSWSLIINVLLRRRKVYLSLHPLQSLMRPFVFLSLRGKREKKRY